MNKVKKINISEVATCFDLYQPAALTYSGDIYLKDLDSALGMGFHEECSLWRASYLMKKRIIHAIGCYKVNDIDLYINGPSCSWYKDGVVTGSEVMPKYVLDTPEFNSTSFASGSLVQITNPCIVIAGWGINWYGHFITEFVPRLISIHFHDKQILKDLPVYFPSCGSNYLKDFLSELFQGLKINFRFLPEAGAVRFKEAYIPTYVGEKDFYHPILNVGIDNFVSKYYRCGFDAGKVYISRRHKNFSQMSDRFLQNESVVENLLVKRNYRIVAMEDLSFKEKIALLSQVKIILGCWGSGLLNTLFARYGCIVGSLGIGFNMLQSGIGALRCQPTSYLQTSSPRGKQHVDIDVFNHWVDSLEESV